MNIINLYVHNFSIPQNEILVTRQYFIISRNCIDRANIRGTVHFVLPDCASTQIRLKSATSDIGYPFYFQVTSFGTFGHLRNISTLHIPNCNLTDLELIRICQSMYGLESLDISVCVNLRNSTNEYEGGLRSLNLLKRLKKLYVAFLDVCYQCVNELLDLEFLDISYVFFPNIALMHLLMILPKLSRVVRCEKFLGQTVSRVTRQYLKIILPHLQVTPPEISVDFYCEFPLARVIYSYNIPNLQLTTLLDSRLPEEVREICVTQKARSRYFHLEGIRWVRNVDYDIDLSVNEF